MDLFDRNLEEKLSQEAPLADRMRPKNFDEFVGQKHLVSHGKPLRASIERDEIPSMIFWGPPGSGKTTLAWIIAKVSKSFFFELHAVSSGLSELRRIISKVKEERKLYNKRSILFIDEIHRWNKVQQDALLPYVEKGIITLIGATTENPSFEVNSALLSRARVFILEQLFIQDIREIIKRAISDVMRGYGKISIATNEEALDFLANISNGDARIALNALEFIVSTHGKSKKEISLTKDVIKDSITKSAFLYDRAGDLHYSIVSALHKSIRGSNADAALYWLCRMLEAGEDPLYIARRLIRMAVEDIGISHPEALSLAVSCYQGCHYLGMPECDIILAECVVYLARQSKSVEVYKAYVLAKEDVRNTQDEPVPLHLRNAPTKFMKEIGYGKDYKYSPDFDWKEDQEYFPEKLKGRKYLSDKK